MRVRITVGWLILVSLVAAIGYAQEPPARTLSLAEALDIARRSSPDYRMVTNNRWTAAASSRAAAFQLLTPNVSVSGSRDFSASGSRSPAAGFPAQTFPPVTNYGWSLGMSYNLSGAIIANRGLARAELRATESDIGGALSALDFSVREQYLNVLQMQAAAQVAQRSVERVVENLNLARARFTVGQGTLIEVRTAEVEKATADVALLRANQAVTNAVLTLFQRLGIPAPEPVAVHLTDSFPVSAPSWSQADLVAQALQQNPALLALRSRADAASWNVRSARSEFLPSFFFQAGLIGGYRQHTTIDTNSRDTITGAPLTNAPAVPITSTGTNPLRFSIGASLPIFDQWRRSVTLQQARAGRDDATEAVRGRELQLRAEVVAAYLGLLAGYSEIDLQRTSKTAAAEALELATQRYRVGSGTYLELLTARNAADQADRNYVTSVYNYHKAIATLENAVGRPLR